MKIRKNTLLAGAIGLSMSLGASECEIKLGDVADGHEVSPVLWGAFFEDINWAADGGIYPELIANAGFDWSQADHEKWNCREDGWEGDFRNDGMARLSFQYGAPIHPNTAKHLRIETFGTGIAGVRNRGYDGIFLENGAKYRLAFNWRELAKSGIDYELGEWKSVEKIITADSDIQTIHFPGNHFQMELARDKKAKDGRYTFSILVSGRRTVEFDNVSLKPVDTIAGLRKDLVQALADLKPSFLRFPGGCIVEEGDFQHWYDWRRTVGPMERRECIVNRWVRPNAPYWETFGLGYYEYFLLCEAIGAEPLPICLSGLTCQFQTPPQLAAVEDMDYFAQVVIDLIEFANGDVSTTWGKVRAEMGHPAPFNLKYVGIGNENWDQVFLDRYDAIQKIVKAAHPEIIIVGSSGPSPDGKRFDLAWNWYNDKNGDIVDEHYYRPPEWFLSQAHRYDSYARTGKPKVYAGEYACHDEGNGKRNTHYSAICEAAAMTGFERNADVVVMASYAPLFARVGHNQWHPNLIWFDGKSVCRTPNYYVQQMFSLNRPTRTIPVEVTGSEKVYASAGVDEKSGTTIVKLVNATDKSVTAKTGLSGKATVTTLAGEAKAENTLHGETVVPVTTEAVLDGTIILPPLSLTVIKL